MLNRLFIAIGVLVILAIGAAFVVPRFIQWGDYRGRLESMAAAAFGTEVAIDGDIHLTLLPAPKLEFTKVRVGPVSKPVLEVAQVDAEFSLLDFLRDQYKVTGLVLDQPVVSFEIARDGSVSSGITLAESAGVSNVSIANATVVNGAVRLADARSGNVYGADGINGGLRLDAIKGPFTFQGSATVDHTAYDLRVSTTKFDAANATTLSVFLKADNGAFTLDSSGALQAGAAFKYSGNLNYRQPPPRGKQGEAVDAGRGDLVLTGKVEATPSRVLLSDYVALPDENRPETRLTGAAELKVGADTSFNAILSGGVVSLPPRDATKELTDPPYELVRLLAETPLPPIPDIKGTVGLDITELDLRSISLRDVRLSASTDTKSWTITEFLGGLPGNTKLGFSGKLSVADDKPIFAGKLSLDSGQLDRLAAVWRKPPAGNPLFGKSGTLTANVALSSDALTVSSGTLVVSGINQGFNAEIGFEQPRRLKLGVHFTSLGADDSATIAALLPDVAASGSFGATFPKGAVDLSASKATVFGLDGTNLVANATWEGGVLEFSKLSAEDLGGLAIDAKLTAFGTLAKPELSGSGTLRIDGDATAADAVFAALNTPPAVADFLRQSLPADVKVRLDAPQGSGGQTLQVTGRVGAADVTLESKLSAGIANALTAPASAKLDLKSDNSLLMTRQIGFGATSIFGDGTPLHLTLALDGVPSNSYETKLLLEGGGDHIGFDGNVVPGDFTRITGNGAVDVKLDDPAILAEAIGAGGIYLPPLAGKADLQFTGTDSAELSRLQVAGLDGDLTLRRSGDRATIGGSLSLKSLDLHALVPALAGAASTVASPDSLWPQGPIDLGNHGRSTDGRIDVKVGALTNGDAPVLSNASFGYDWDAQSLHLRNLSGQIGGGTLGFDATVCCSSTSTPEKQVTGRVTLSGVALDAVVPVAIAATLDGTLDGSASFNGSGETLGQAIETMNGTGSYTVTGFSAAGFDPAVFTAASTISGVVDMDPAALARTVTEKLQSGAFTAPSLTGTFNIANGTVRSPNLAVTGEGARIFGGASLSLKDLLLDARYTMSPTGQFDDKSAIDPATAEVDAEVKGSLWAPSGSYDVAALVDGMKIKANEVELALLEQRRAEADARAKAAAELQKKIDVLASGTSAASAGAASEVAQKQAADLLAAQKAAEETAAKQAAAAEAAQKAAAAEAARRAASSSVPPPLDLGM